MKKLIKKKKKFKSLRFALVQRSPACCAVHWGAAYLQDPMWEWEGAAGRTGSNLGAAERGCVSGQQQQQPGGFLYWDYKVDKQQHICNIEKVYEFSWPRHFMLYKTCWIFWFFNTLNELIVLLNVLSLNTNPKLGINEIENKNHDGSRIVVYFVIFVCQKNIDDKSLISEGG